MSSLAAAKKRRAGVAAAPPPPEQTRGAPYQNQNSSPYQNQNAPPAPTPGVPNLTIHQVIELVDRRLISLEAGAREAAAAGPSTDLEEHVAASLEETDRRFEMLAEEVDGLKTLLLGLQSYTMDVNKMLLERLNAGPAGGLPVAGFEMKVGSMSL